MTAENEALIDAMARERNRHTFHLREPNAVATWHVVCGCGEVFTVSARSLKRQWDLHVERVVLAALQSLPVEERARGLGFEQVGQRWALTPLANGGVAGAWYHGQPSGSTVERHPDWVIVQPLFAPLPDRSQE